MAYEIVQDVDEDGDRLLLIQEKGNTDPKRRAIAMLVAMECEHCAKKMADICVEALNTALDAGKFDEGRCDS